MKEEPVYEMFWWAMLSDYEKQVLKEWVNLERLNKSYRRMKKTGEEDFQVLIERAKEYPISELARCRNDKDKVMIRSSFCNDSNPSCCIYNNTNSWYCFATNQGGSTIDWQMKVNRMNFKQAVRSLT
jgi:DNA primase